MKLLELSVLLLILNNPMILLSATSDHQDIRCGQVITLTEKNDQLHIKFIVNTDEIQYEIFNFNQTKFKTHWQNLQKNEICNVPNLPTPTFCWSATQSDSSIQLHNIFCTFGDLSKIPTNHDDCFGPDCGGNTIIISDF